MNLTKTSQILIFILAFFNAFDMFADMAVVAESKMAPPPMVELEKVIAHYKTKQKTKKLTDDETNILTLANAASEIFSVNHVQLRDYSHNTDDQKFAAISSMDLSLEIQKALRAKPTWEPTLTGQQLEKVKQIEDLIKKDLAETSYAWAWIKYQQGDKKTPKAILSKLFNDTYEATMKMKHLGFRDSNPLYESTSMSKILTPLSSPVENKDREDKLKKMKVHISNMPDLQIMT